MRSKSVFHVTASLKSYLVFLRVLRITRVGRKSLLHAVSRICRTLPPCPGVCTRRGRVGGIALA
ncbi:unnamed protein product [Amoebophrya sp. A25]|nr:unnamed protein product [Amoebophrya sp. A25]|eukprot:GSA25T00018988001.1